MALPILPWPGGELVGLSLPWDWSCSDVQVLSQIDPGAPGMGQHCLGSAPCKLQRPEDM